MKPFALLLLALALLSAGCKPAQVDEHTRFQTARDPSMAAKTCDDFARRAELIAMGRDQGETRAAWTSYTARSLSTSLDPGNWAVHEAMIARVFDQPRHQPDDVRRLETQLCRKALGLDE
jgi:hypothetical protein